MTVITINNYSDKELNYDSLINMYQVVHGRNTNSYLSQQELENRTCILKEIPTDIDDVLRNKNLIVLKTDSKTDYSRLKDLPDSNYKLFIVNNVLLDLSKQTSESINSPTEIHSKVYDLISFINMGVGKNMLGYLLNDMNLRVANYLSKVSSNYEINIFHLNEYFTHSNGLQMSGSDKKQYIIKEKKNLIVCKSDKKGRQLFDDKMFAIFNESGYKLISENDLKF